MSRFYIAVLGVTAFLIAGTGAYFSVFGLSELFSGSAKSVIFMASMLEFAKFVVTGFLYRYWGHIHRVLRVYLTVSVLTLMGITSLGIFGYLSNAYQKSSLVLKTHQLKMATLVDEDLRIQKQISDFRKFIDEIPNRRISKKLEFQTKYEPKIRKLQIASSDLQTKISDLKLELLNTQTKVGPLLYVAEVFNTNIDTVAKWLIFIFVMVFDPMAVCLILCWNLAILLYEKYKGDESKIGKRSVMIGPVDHRFKKSA